MRPLLLLIATLITMAPAAGADSDNNSVLDGYLIGATIESFTEPYWRQGVETYPFPVITRFEDPDFSDSLFFSRGQAYGLRTVRESGLEAGIQLRYQALAYDPSDDPQLAGLPLVEDTAEAGPYAGWRWSKFQVRLSSFLDILDNHDGTELRLEFSRPVNIPRGFLTAFAYASWQDDDYVNHYYGVAPSLANATRPAYVADDATNYGVGLRVLRRISDRWYVKGRATFEQLDNEIDNSPIVDRDTIWFVGIGLAVQLGE